MALGEGMGDVLATGLAGGIGASGTKRVILQGAAGRHVAVHLVGADQEEHFMLVPAGRVAEHRRAEDVGVHEGERVGQGTVDVGLRREVDHRVHLARELVDQGRVADISLDEAESLVIGELCQVCRVAGIRELVRDPELGVRVSAAHELDEVGPR